MNHSIEITFTPGDYPDYKVVCTAPDTAWCRLMPTCECEERHDLDCPKTTEPYAGCLYRDWFENYSVPESGEGTVALNIDIEWTGDDWTWLPQFAEVKT